MIQDMKETVSLHSKPIDLSKDVLNEPLLKSASTGNEMPPFYPSVVWDFIWTLTNLLDDLCDSMVCAWAYIPSVNYNQLKAVFKFLWRIIVVTVLVDFDTDTTTILINFMVPTDDIERPPNVITTGPQRRFMFLCCTPIQYAKLKKIRANVPARNIVS